MTGYLVQWLQVASCLSFGLVGGLGLRHLYTMMYGPALLAVLVGARASPLFCILMVGVSLVLFAAAVGHVVSMMVGAVAGIWAGRRWPVALPVEEVGRILGKLGARHDPAD